MRGPALLAGVLARGCVKRIAPARPSRPVRERNGVRAAPVLARNQCPSSIAHWFARSHEPRAPHERIAGGRRLDATPRFDDPRSPKETTVLQNSAIEAALARLPLDACREVLVDGNAPLGWSGDAGVAPGSSLPLIRCPGRRGASSTSTEFLPGPRTDRLARPVSRFPA